MAQDILTEVRKAYRLLFDYQTKLLALVKYIGGKYGYNYNGGYPKFSNNQPRQGRGNLDDWAWDWLNLYFHEFHFGSKKIDVNTKMYFSLFILNDDGYFLACQKEQQNVGRVNPNKFEKPENSNSKLIFVVGLNSWIGKAYFAENNWSNQRFTLEEKGIHEDENGKMFYKTYPLENFFEENNAIVQLADFERECHVIGIPFKQIKMEIK